MGSTMFFGTLYDTQNPGSSSTTSNARMSYVPAPDPGMDAGASGYSELLEFENGGADVVSSAQTHRNYGMTWNLREAFGAQGLDMIKNYQQKLYGPGLIYFADPMNFRGNLFPPQFAAPGLIEQGWKSIMPPELTSSFVNTPTGSNFYPTRSITTNNLSHTLGRIVPIVIPSDMTLYVYFKDQSTVGGYSGPVHARAISLDGSYATATTPSVNGTSGTTQYAYNGATYKAVEFWMTGLNGGLNFTASMAQLWPTTMAAPNLSTTKFIGGSGNTGCKFTSEAIVESYVLSDNAGSRHYKGMAVDLTEVGLWQRLGT